MTNEPTTPEVGGETCPTCGGTHVRDRIDYGCGGPPIPSKEAWERSPLNARSSSPQEEFCCVNAHDRCYEGGPCPYCERLVSPPAVQEEGLKPCPFCGDTDAGYSVEGFVFCRRCACEGPDAPVEGEDGMAHRDAIAAWNRRPSPAIPDREEIVGVLRGLLEITEDFERDNLIYDHVPAAFNRARSLLAKLEGKS